ncbi:PREDICTED: myosin-binding protein 3-like isoform X2 [Lupinus angustifolius]|uniref:myosin-binding protein 3-like isoform X2 n=1 Tax=Lupinus angustifolius TaxID=3871 RepID=UPI00092E8B6D|nr:PREDICTED: myosin-binding protein 3-like isoform X2 [Lupinus angustifolius]
MAASGSETSFVKTKRTKGFIALLTTAACEWFLIFLLLVDAVVSFLLTKFASYCQLQLPCLLCSRLDHIFGCEKPEFYQNLFCCKHKSEITSLISCHIHGKVADGHRMCDDCLLSFTTTTNPNTKTHRLLAGKLGLVLGGSGFQSPSLSRDLFTASKGSRQCICCGKLWKSEQNASRSIQLKSSGRAVLKPYIPLPHAQRQSRLNHRENSKKVKDKFYGTEGKGNFHHVGYTELRLNSDSESEFLFSDDDDNVNIFHENIEAGNDPTTQFTPMIPPKCIQDDLNPAKAHVEHNISKHYDEKFLGSDAVNDDDLEDFNLLQENKKSPSSDVPVPISLDEVSPSPIAVNHCNNESEVDKGSYLSHTLVGSSSNKSADATLASGTGLVFESHGDILENIDTMEIASIETDPVISDSAPTNTSPMPKNSSSMSKSNLTSMEREVPGFVTEQPTIEEVVKVREELELSPSRSTSPHGSNMSSEVPINHARSPVIDDETSNSNAIQGLQKSASVESALESLDGSNDSEIEGESIVDRLKRQIEHDKKYVDSLQKELEEERNASAIAANEAMSMITRLQEEKAALQMETLQYLRMMEEQAEYDNDELDKVNDLLTEKEKEIQDLEAELEFYRLNLTDDHAVHNMPEESCDSKGGSVTEKNVGAHNSTDTLNIVSDLKFPEVSEVSNEAVPSGTSSLEFEEEKQYISECLKNLEKKLHQLPWNGISSDIYNVRPEKLEVGESNELGSSKGEGPQLDSHEETDLSTQKNIGTSNGNHTDKGCSAASDSGDCSLDKENINSTCVGQKDSPPMREVDLVALENEMSDLNDRLEALEFDRDLLEHIINSLRNGDVGKQFIQDIAHQLHELRKIGIRSKCRHVNNGGHTFLPGGVFNGHRSL